MDNFRQKRPLCAHLALKCFKLLPNGAYCVFDFKDKIFCKMFVLINIYFDFVLWKHGRSTKGGLISEGILNLVSFANKMCQITPSSKIDEFPAHNSKKTSEIKPPLISLRMISMSKQTALGN